MDENSSFQRLHELSTYLEQINEAERSLIARDIHDNITALLTAIKLDTCWLEKRCASISDEVDGKFSTLSENLDRAINTTRQLISDLRPSVLDDLGLIAALDWYTRDFARRQELDCNFQAEVDELSLTNKQDEITVFRIFQEALSNIAKHARANAVTVKLSRENTQVELTVDDDGIGIQEKKEYKQNFGILGMHQRAKNIGGELTVSANEDRGTRISLVLPLG